MLFLSVPGFGCRNSIVLHNSSASRELMAVTLCQTETDRQDFSWFFSSEKIMLLQWSDSYLLHLLEVLIHLGSFGSHQPLVEKLQGHQWLCR